MTTQPPRIPRVSGTPAWAQQAPTSDDPQRPAAATQQQPYAGYPMTHPATFTAAQGEHPAATAQRVRARDTAKSRVGGITAALAVAALVGTGAAVVATSDLGSSTTTATSTTSSSDSSGSSSSSSDTSSSSGTTVSSSNQSSVASTSGS